MNKQQGFILVFMFSLLACLSLLLFVQLEIFILYQKQQGNLGQKQKALYQLESFAMQLLKQPINKACVCKEELGSEAAILLKQNSFPLMCTQANFRFVIEALGTFPCIGQKMAAKLVGTEHYRFFIKRVDREEVLELRFAKLSPGLSCEQPVFKELKTNSAIVNWRLS